MNQRRVIVGLSMIVLLLLVPTIEGYSSGAHNRASGCNCHSQSGSAVASVDISGLPSSYEVDKLYQITVSVNGGVSGSGGGFSLQVDKGKLSTGIGAMLVKVNSQGSSATHTTTGNSYRSWSFEWTSPAPGSGLVTFDVAGMTANGNGGTSGDRWVTYTVQIAEDLPTNSPPAISELLLNPTDAKTSDPLTLSYIFNDPDGDAESGSEITWYRDGEALPHGIITGLTVPVSQTQKGQEWYAEVRPSDGEDFGTLQASNIITIENTPPEVSNPAITPESPTSADALGISFTISDADEDSLTSTIRWYLDGTRVTEFDNETSVPSLATRDGDQWRVELAVSDGDEEVTKTSQNTVVEDLVQPNNPPEVISYSIIPTMPNTTDNLQLLFDIKDADQDVITDIEIIWRLNDQLTQETGITINSNATQKGQLWEAAIRATDGKNWSDLVTISVVIQNTAPTVEFLAITPSTAYTNDELSITYSAADLDGDPLDNPLIKWYKNGSEQTNLTGLATIPSSYTTKGENWSVSVYAYDGDNFSELARQSAILIQNSLPTVTIGDLPANLTLVDSMELGLSINPLFFDLDGDKVNYQIIWLRNGFQEGTLDNASFVARDYFGAGQLWTCQILFDDGDSLKLSETWDIAIDNIAPVAEINVDSRNLWAGEIIVLNGSSSYDKDGVITNYLWQLLQSNGELLTTNEALAEIVVFGQATVILTVEDDLGGSSISNITIQTTQGPSVSALKAVNDGTQVVLSWQWNGPDAQFIILRNGIEVGQVSGYQFTDKPVLSGSTEYIVKPIVDDQRLIEGSMTIADFPVQITSQPAEGLSETGGFLIGIILLLIGFATALLGLLRRRVDDE